jgi:hypothetical protein
MKMDLESYSTERLY